MTTEQNLRTFTQEEAETWTTDAFPIYVRDVIRRIRKNWAGGLSKIIVDFHEGEELVFKSTTSAAFKDALSELVRNVRENGYKIRVRLHGSRSMIVVELLS